MERNWKLLGVSGFALVVACQWQPPQSLPLEDARRLYESRPIETPPVAESLREATLETTPAATLISPR